MTVDERKYLESLVSLLASDKKAVLLYVAFELAVVVFTVKDLAIGGNVLFPQDGVTAPVATRLTLLLSLVFFLVASWLHFLYYRQIHRNEMAVVQYFLSGRVQGAKKMIFDAQTGLWAQHGWKYILANLMLTGGIILYVLFFVAVLF